MSNVINKKTGQSLQDAIIDLYLNVKVRSSDEVHFCMRRRQIEKFSEEQYHTEKSALNSTDSFVLLDYIRSSVEMIMTMKLEDLQASALNIPTTTKDETATVGEYEAMLQRLEAESRNHIRTEQQLKLHNESLQSQGEELVQELHRMAARLVQVEDVSLR